MGRDSYATHISKSPLLRFQWNLQPSFPRDPASPIFFVTFSSSFTPSKFQQWLPESDCGAPSPPSSIQRSHHEACSFHPVPLSQASPLFFVLPPLEAAFTVPTLQVSNLVLALVPAGNCLKIRSLRRGIYH
ncbi:hypothetical protein ACFX13_002659 [Malus domestica]